MPTKSKRRKALESLPPNLYTSFQNIITRIRNHPNESQAEIGVRVLMWIHFACRPLTLVELQHALAVEKNDVEFDADNIPPPKAVLDYCLGLVVVDEETSTVRFVHYTLEEYFLKCTGTEFPNGCSYTAETCLTYLNFGKLRPHCASLDSLRANLNEYAFLSYAALYWGIHVKQKCNDDGLDELSKRIVNHGSELPPCAIQALYLELDGNDKDWSQQSIVQKFSGVHATAYFGLSQHMAYFCMVEQYMDQKDETDRTPLSWAAEYGHESVVRMLIEREEVDINSKDNRYEKTPLSWAAEKGHEAVVQLLIKRDGVEINSRDMCGRTFLSVAAEQAYKAVTQLVIKKNFVRNSHRSISSLIMDGNIVTLRVEENGRLTHHELEWVRSQSYKRLLINGDDADINVKDKSVGWTPLMWAAGGGHEAIVRLLIEKEDIEINAKAKDGRTPLSVAAAIGHEAIVQMLISRDDVDVNAKDNHGIVPMAVATMMGHEAIAHLLLKRNDVDVDAKEKDGWTPLMFAAQSGHEAVVQLLIQRNDVDVDAKDKNGQTPLMFAAESGHEAVVRLLIERNDIDVDAKEKDGWTPLMFAAQKGHEAVVRLLIERNDVDVDAKEKDGWTPLMLAAQNGHEAVVRLLIERNDVDVDGKDNYGCTPLSLAAAMGYDAIVQLLKNNDNCRISDIDIIAKDNREKSVVSLPNEGPDVGAKGSDITSTGIFVGDVAHSEVGEPAGSVEYQDVSDVQDLGNGEEDL